jgi:hypothetical protein
VLFIYLEATQYIVVLMECQDGDQVMSLNGPVGNGK